MHFRRNCFFPDAAKIQGNYVVLYRILITFFDSRCNAGAKSNNMKLFKLVELTEISKSILKWFQFLFYYIFYLFTTSTMEYFANVKEWNQ